MLAESRGRQKNALLSTTAASVGPASLVGGGKRHVLDILAIAAA